MPATGALLAQNLEYSSGMVGTRHGFKSAAVANATATIATAMYCWYGPFSQATLTTYSDSVLLWYGATIFSSAPGLGYANLGAPASFGSILGLSSTGGTITGTVTMSAVGVGPRCYIAFINAAQKGTLAICFTTFSSGGTLSVATLKRIFDGPMTYVPPAPTEPGVGVVTAGIHRFGYILEFSDGFTTRVSPDTGASSPPNLTSFTPITFTAAGVKNLLFTFNPSTDANVLTWPAGIVAISMVMTTIDNLNQYYVVPGSRTAIASILDYPKTITVNISDADLSSQGIDATPYLYWLTSQPVNISLSNSGASPFNPSHISLWGDRMAYKGYYLDNKGSQIDALYVSERNNYQAITADQHIVQLPGQRDIVTFFRMGSVNYIVGAHEIYATTDNGDVPITWAAPKLVDGHIGTLAVHGVEVAPSGGYAWIADQAGLYLFAGAAVNALPISYQQTPDWNRINWSVAWCLTVKDEAGEKKVHVLVALDGATTPSHKMTWDYTNGMTHDTVMYSLDSLTSYNLGSMELVRNDLAGQATGNQQKIELWLGPSSSAAILRQCSDFDTNPFRDVASKIADKYRTCPFPGRDRGQGIIQSHHGFSARLKGAGTITPVLYDIDAAHNFPCRTLTLATAPDQDELFFAEARNELAFIEFASAAIDGHWQMAYLKYYWTPWLMQR